MKDLWNETFPDHRKNVASKINERRQKAQEMKKYTPEELEEMEASIPEWKKGALTVHEGADEEQSKGLFKRAMSNAKAKINKTKFIKDLHDNEDFKKLKQQYHEFKEDMTDVREKVKDQIDTTDSRAVSTTRDIGNVIF